MPSSERVSRGNYIHGQFLKVEDPNGEVDSRNPGDLTRSPVSVPFSFEHVPEAVSAARRSSAAWRRLPPAQRQAAVKRYRDLMKERSETLAWHLAFEIGKPLWEARLEVGETLDAMDHFLAEAAVEPREIAVEDGAEHGVIRFHARGTMVVIPAAAQPVFGPHTAFVPALLHGNAIIVKASKHSPMTAQFQAELWHDAGIPAGVCNLLQGDAEVARRLCSDPDVDGVFFTGHYETAFKVKKQLLSDYWKTVVIEAGGKNTVLVWDDCDYRRALHDSLLGAFLSTGQRHATSNRILVHEKLFDQFLEDFHQLAKKCRVGNALTEGDAVPFMGPLLSEDTLENYLRYQGIAVREGCEEVMRGKQLEREEKGYYVSPSIHVVHKPEEKSVYQKNEVIGPNVAVYRIQELEEAIELLNQQQYALAAAVYTGAREIYLRVSEEARVGMFHWNRPTTTPAYRLAHGGLKKSGNARPLGRFSGLQCTYPVSSWEGTGSGATTYPAALPQLAPRKESESKA